MTDNIQRAITNLRTFTPPPTNYYKCPIRRRAAVLILLFADKGGDLRVVLTIRSAGLKNCEPHPSHYHKAAPYLTQHLQHQMRAKQLSQAAKQTPSKKRHGKPPAVKPGKKSASP